VAIKWFLIQPLFSCPARNPPESDDVFRYNDYNSICIIMLCGGQPRSESNGQYQRKMQLIQTANLIRIIIIKRRSAKKAAMNFRPIIRNSFSSNPSMRKAIVENKSPISAIQIKMPAPGQCRILNKNAINPTINVSEPTMTLNFSIPPESFDGIPESSVTKNKIPAAVPHNSIIFAPGQCIVLKKRPISKRTVVMIDAILMVLIMAENELVNNK
jgi:hypothetical protein